MSTILTLPRLGETMESGRVATWTKHAGDVFRRGETLVEIESDKTVVELPALCAGRLIEILVPEGTDVAVGDPLCRYEAADGAVPAAPPSAVVVAAPAAPPPVVAAAPAPAVATLPAADKADAVRRRATPLARRLARHHDIVLASLTGTGRRGRIGARDVLAVLPATSGAVAPVRQAAVEAAPVASATAAVGACAISIALAPIATLRERLGDAPLAVEDFFIKAAARALRALPAQFPQASIGWPGEAGEVVLHDADRLTLGTVSAQRHAAPAGAAALSVTWIGRAGVRPCLAALAPGQRARLLVAAAGAAQAECLLVYRADALDDNEAAELLGRIQDAMQDPLGLLL
jgi:pyruvate/2-oxoglutarate dehydrogenase complex dihydrolipoamide acyltransferase (E2) component